MADTPRLAIIVPMLNERASLPALLEHLRSWRDQGVEVILVDGGSEDSSALSARASGFRVVDAPRGRARQMNAGAAASQAQGLLFLHADTRLPPTALQQVERALAKAALVWGRFDVQIDGRSRLLSLVGWMMNLRSRLSGIATGDQAIFISRAAFERVGGFPDQPLMEDIEISKRLKRLARPICLRQRVTTSGRRWDSRGPLRTILLMWQLRWAYWRGCPAERLAERYQ